jgi:hypothetical protein
MYDERQQQGAQGVPVGYNPQNPQGAQNAQAAPTAPAGNYPPATNSPLPYEVYQTVHAPTARRRRWIFRSIAAVIIVALLVAGVVALRRNSDKTTNKPGGTSTVQPKSNEPGGSQKPTQQAPQNNAPLPKSDNEPVTVPQNSAKNTGTVNQPE